MDALPHLPHCAWIATGAGDEERRIQHQTGLEITNRLWAQGIASKSPLRGRTASAEVLCCYLPQAGEPGVSADCVPHEDLSSQHARQKVQTEELPLAKQNETRDRPLKLRFSWPLEGLLELRRGTLQDLQAEAERLQTEQQRAQPLCARVPMSKHATKSQAFDCDQAQTGGSSEKQSQGRSLLQTQWPQCQQQARGTSSCQIMPIVLPLLLQLPLQFLFSMLVVSITTVI